MLTPSFSTAARRQGGMALIEALVALVVLSLGALALLGVQLRTLADTRTATHRATAIRLIGDLSERINNNPSGLSNLSAYQSAWGASPSSASCASSKCDAAQLAAADIYEWKQNIKNTLPDGKAAVVLTTSEAGLNRRQLGVIVGWRENERKREGGTDTEYTAKLKQTNTAHDCEDGYTCHFQYIGPQQRCYMPDPVRHPGAGAVCPD